MKFFLNALLVGATLTLGSCGGQSERATPTPSSSPSATPSDETSAAPPLEELSQKDLLEAHLSGELGCSFRRAEGASPIWTGAGDVIESAGAVGLVKLGGATRKLAMIGTGGFDAMAQGARFEGDGIAVAIGKTADKPLAEEPQVAMESPVYPARMTVAVAGEPERTVQGLFECGP